jgi:cytochrome c
MKIQNSSLLFLSSCLLFCYVGKSFGSSENQNYSAENLAKTHLCLSCHGIDKKIIGPSFREIAKKYPNNTNTLTYLNKRVRNGGAGVWGVVAMPANQSISSDELNLVLEWVLTQNKSKD